MVVPQFMTFVFSVLLLQTFIFPDFLLAQRNGETGRYMYTDNRNQNLYCHYCDEKDLDKEANVAQVGKCIEKNFPFQNNTDAEEQRSKLRPICKRGKLPSCPLLRRSLNGEWNCSHNPHLMESQFYDKTVDGYILPVYTSCSLVCIEGYHVIGTNSLYCNESRQWDTEKGMIHCAQDHTCPLLNRTLNGEWDCHDKVESKFYKETVDGYIFPVDTSCSLVCSEGYHVIGPNIIHCNESHQWDTETGVIHCAKNPGQNVDVREHHLPVIIGSVISVCAVIGIVGIIFIYCFVCKGASYETAEEESSVESGTSSSSVYCFKEVVKDIKGNEDGGNEIKSLLEPSSPVSIKKEEKYFKNLKTPVEHKDLSDYCFESTESYFMQEQQIYKGLQEGQIETILRASYEGDNDDKAVNQAGRDMSNSCQLLSKRRPGDGIEAGTRIDSVMKTDMTVDRLGLDNLKGTHPQNMSDFKDLVVEDNDTNGSKIQVLRKMHEKEPPGGQKKSPVIAEGGSDPKVKVAYLSEEQGRERLMVREYKVNSFSVPLGRRFFIIPKCQGTIKRLNVCKDVGHYRGLQYGSYQFLHMVESARAEDHGLYRWEIFVVGFSAPKYWGRLYIDVVLDQLGCVSLPPLDSNLLSSPFWQSMNPESLLDDNSLSVRDRPSGTSYPPIINQAGSGASTGLHQQDTGSATCPGTVAAAENVDKAVARRQFNSDPYRCTQTVESAWNENSPKMEELIHRGEDKFMPWTHLGSRVLDMEPWFLECLEWHLRGRVHDGPMKYILKQMVHDGKKIGHLVEHFACVDRYDLVNCIKAFHSCDYCKCFYKP